MHDYDTTGCMCKIHALILMDVHTMWLAFCSTSALRKHGAGWTDLFCAIRQTAIWHMHVPRFNSMRMICFANYPLLA
jgi:hypothetical protein